MLKEKLKELPDYVSAIVYIIIGLALVIFCEQITPAIPYVFGGLLVLNGVLRVIKYFTQKLYKVADNSNLIIASIMLALGVVFICSPARGLELFALFWGIHAIISGVECLHRIFFYASRKQKWLIYLGEGIIEFVLGIMLLVEFGEGITTHLIILGVYLILIGIFSIFGVSLEKQGERPIESEDESKSGIASVLEEFDDIGDFIPDRNDFRELIPEDSKLKARKKSTATPNNTPTQNPNNNNDTKNTPTKNTNSTTSTTSIDTNTNTTDLNNTSIHASNITIDTHNTNTNINNADIETSSKSNSTPHPKPKHNNDTKNTDTNSNTNDDNKAENTTENIDNTKTVSTQQKQEINKDQIKQISQASPVQNTDTNTTNQHKIKLTETQLKLISKIFKNSTIISINGNYISFPPENKEEIINKLTIQVNKHLDKNYEPTKQALEIENLIDLINTNTIDK